MRSSLTQLFYRPTLSTHLSSQKIRTCASRSIVEKVFVTIHTIIRAHTFSFWVLQWRRFKSCHHHLYLITCPSRICSSITYSCLQTKNVKICFKSRSVYQYAIYNIIADYQYNFFYLKSISKFLFIYLQTDQEA